MNSKILFEAELPILNNVMFADKEKAINFTKGAVQIIDSKYGYLYNKKFNEEFLKYENNYQNEQNFSSRFREHLEQILNELTPFHDKLIVEIGCGKGFFLESAKQRGFRIIGYDPTYEGNNPDIFRKNYDPEDDFDEIKSVDKERNGVLFILRHVLEHIPEPLNYLSKLAKKARKEDLIFIEVPCLDWIVEHKAFFDFTYEHCNYFDFEGLGRQFSRIIRRRKCFGEQYMYCLAELASFKQRKIRINEAVLEKTEQISQELKASIEKFHCHNKNAVVWGCAGKGVMWAYHAKELNLSKNLLGFVDINPAKQRKYAPGSGLYCYAPENIPQSAEMIIIANPNYESEIRLSTNNNYKYIVI